MNKIFSITAGISVLLLLLTGCGQKTPAAQDMHSLFQLQEIKGDATLSLFMKLTDPLGESIWMEMEDVEVFSGENWFPIASTRSEIDSNEISAAGQILIGRGGLPSGFYSRLRFKVGKAALARLGEKIILSVDNPVVELSFSSQLRLQKGDSPSLFLTWDSSASIQNKVNFLPRIDVSMQSIPLTTDLAYVSCPAINTVYIVRTDQNLVCGSIGVSGHPTCLKIIEQNNRFYVLSSDQGTIKIFELSSNRILDEVRIPHVQEASYMDVDPSGEWAYVVDERGDQLFRINLSTGVLSDRVRLGSRPKYIMYQQEESILVVSSAYDQKVFYIDPTNLSIVKTLTTGGSPDGLIVLNNLLFVAESSTNMVSVFDTNSGRARAQIHVGRTPRRFVSNFNSIYLANYGEGTVSILRAGQLNVLRDIPVGGNPLEMAVYPARQWLYVGDEGGRGLSVIDLTSNMVVKTIELATPVSGIAVVN